MTFERGNEDGTVDVVELCPECIEDPEAQWMLTDESVQCVKHRTPAGIHW